jgi:hypothetical protein
LEKHVSSYEKKVYALCSTTARVYTWRLAKHHDASVLAANYQHHLTRLLATLYQTTQNSIELKSSAFKIASNAISFVVPYGLYNTSAIAKVVSLLLLISEKRFQSQASPCGFCFDKNITRVGFFLSTSHILYQLLFQYFIIIHKK